MKIPSSIAAGEYLLRVEHIALHVRTPRWFSLPAEKRYRVLVARVVHSSTLGMAPQAQAPCVPDIIYDQLRSAKGYRGWIC